MALTLSVFIMSSSGMSIICPPCTMPALLTSKVTGPTVFFTSAYCNDLPIDYFIDTMIKESKRGKALFTIILPTI